MKSKRSTSKDIQQQYPEHQEFLELGGEIGSGVKLIDFFDFNQEAVYSTLFSNNGKLIAVTFGSSIWIIDIEKKTKELFFDKESEVRALVWSSDDNKLAFSIENEIILVEAGSKNIIQTLKGHKSWVNKILFIENDRVLISGSADKSVRIWELDTKQKNKIIARFNSIIANIHFIPKKNWLLITTTDGVLSYFLFNNKEKQEPFFLFASGNSNGTQTTVSSELIAVANDNTIYILNIHSQDTIVNIEAHTSMVIGLTFSSDGKLLISKSWDGTVKLWKCGTWECLIIISESVGNLFPIQFSYSAMENLLITRYNDDKGIRIWQIDINKLINGSNISKVVKYTTAKIVLVGDSGVGKTGLGWRLSQGTFKEHESTHGQQFWVVDDLGITRSDGTECEAVLWDLAGQPDYRLVHSLFLDNVNLGLILFDPTSRLDSMSSPLFWLKQLHKNQSSDCPTILIGSRTDRGTSTLTEKELTDFSQQHNILGGYIGTSAKNNDGIPELIEKIKVLVPWDNFSTTITTVTFKKIKEFVLKLKESTERKISLVTYEQLTQELNQGEKTLDFNEEELKAAVKNLENHGYVSIIQNSKLETFILLYPDLIINLASSFILEARKNIKGLGVLEEAKLLNGNYHFSELDELNASEKETIIDATISLFLKNAICFRENWNDESIYVFPSLINEKRPSSEELSLIEDVSYVITGAVENVYASLVVLLGYTNTFTRNNQWQNQAEYRIGKDERCGFKQISANDGETEFILYHVKDVPKHTKLLFQGLFERFLIRRDIKIKKYVPIICKKCEEQVERSVVINKLAKNKTKCFCSECAFEIDLSRAEETLENNLFEEKLDEQKAIALRRTEFETILVKIKGLLRDTIIKSPPSCFICYAWGNTEYETWVERTANNLKNAGLKVLFDRKSNAPGTSISGYVDQIMEVDFVLVVGTKKLLEKYTAKVGDPVVKAEQKLINTILRRPNEHGTKIIPLLLEGTQQESFTPFLQDIVFHDFTDEKMYFFNLAKLIGQIYNLTDQENFESILKTLYRLN